MNAEELKRRTKEFALRIIRLCAALPHSAPADVIARQLLRAATSVGANYRAACRARSQADFVAKMALVEEEADECGYWLELLAESGLVKADRLADLVAEANELTAIAGASRKTARSRLSGGRSGNHRGTHSDSEAGGPCNRQSTIANRQSP